MSTDATVHLRIGTDGRMSADAQVTEGLLDYIIKAPEPLYDCLHQVVTNILVPRGCDPWRWPNGSQPLGTRMPPERFFERAQRASVRKTLGTRFPGVILSFHAFTKVKQDYSRNMSSDSREISGGYDNWALGTRREIFSRLENLFGRNEPQLMFHEIENRRSEGYDEYFDPPLENEYACPICLLGLREAVQTLCGHRFCRYCILRSIR